MIRPLLALLLALAPTPAQAQWVHKPAGVRVPDTIGDMRRGEIRDLSNGAEVNVMVQYGEGKEPVTLYVYRSSHPSAALWIDRTRTAMASNVGAFDVNARPTPATLFGAAAPNALRQSFVLAPEKGFRATAVAIADHGEWLIKARVTSATLDVAGVTAKMDRLLAAIVVARPAPPRAVTPIAGCEGTATYSPAAPVAGEAAPAATMAATLSGVVAMSAARGGTGLVAQPANWCRATSSIPDPLATLYRERSGKAWVALLGDSGITISAHSLKGDGAGQAGLYLSDPAQTSLLAVLDALPSPEQAFGEHVLPVLNGQRKPLAQVSSKLQ